ncbi:hypothetical protein NBRC10512_004111 [Rhodotorula toruloides]|uniref:RHTO0S03e01530g1_1 n=2 Tax=Rhodotorula toruloides TaxID=5286 RepID=A0A061AKA0_RHOTO|nr:uncharacterized protein RHTO_00102 [Rhodotorula toruloides NP11]EMS25674.1 hypothetical protein RHTO_00102 [Rhodotorula toruloides NP11]KAJ8296109.1 hypothetical protein OF846_001423 [Rhodotorula toruloides]CDR37979.1 RHTO0S03e01530g1_1 [Rhodotorula toruloides]
MDWDEISPKFLPVPWAPFTSSEGNLLLKLVYLAKEGVLAVMATDLENVYFETLNRRQTNKRLGDALRANADSQSDVALGIGEEGELLLQESVENLLSAVSSGTAKAEISHEAFEHFIKITIPDRFTVDFLTISLENRSASILASHLVTPLLGVCSSLLALLRDASTDDEALLKRIESAVDSSGKAERMDEGRSMTRFMGLGGPALLGRWTQRSLGAKEKDLQPVTLSLPNRPQRPFSPALNSPAPKRKRSPSPRLPSPPPQQFEPRESVSPIKPVASLAHRMLDHAGAKGERIGWDDSQTQQHEPVPPHNGRSEAKKEVEPVAAADQSVEEEEPATDEDEPLPASSPLLTSVDRSPSQRPPRHLPHASPSGRRDASTTPTATQKSIADASPPPTAETDPEAAEKERKKEAAKKAKAAEEEEEKARRRARLQKAAAGPAQPKKKAKRL